MGAAGRGEAGLGRGSGRWGGRGGRSLGRRSRPWTAAGWEAWGLPAVPPRGLRPAGLWPAAGRPPSRRPCRRLAGAAPSRRGPPAVPPRRAPSRAAAAVRGRIGAPRGSSASRGGGEGPRCGHPALARSPPCPPGSGRRRVFRAGGVGEAGAVPALWHLLGGGRESANGSSLLLGRVRRLPGSASGKSRFSRGSAGEGAGQQGGRAEFPQSLALIFFK